MGLATNTTSSVFQNLALDPTNTSPSLGFFFGRAQSKTNGLSEMTVGKSSTGIRHATRKQQFPDITNTGDVNAAKSSGMTYTFEAGQIAEGATWELDLPTIVYTNKTSTGATIGDQANRKSALIDTAGTFIAAPGFDADQIFLQGGGFPMHYSGEWNNVPTGEFPTDPIRYYAFPCATPPPVAFNFGPPGPASGFAVNPLDLNLGQISATGDGFVDIKGSTSLKDAMAGAIPFCLASIVGDDWKSIVNNRWILGSAFLKNWYTVLTLHGDTGDNTISFIKSIDAPPSG